MTCARLSLTLPLWARLLLVTAGLWMTTACGDIKIVPLTADSSAADAAVEAAGGDTGPAVDSAADATADVGTSSDTGATPECVNDFGCIAMKGAGPCSVPKCELGQCKLQLRKENELCTLKLDPTGECETAACDAIGNCVKSTKKDKSACGTTTCGKLCSAGQCIDGTPADYEDGNPCTKDYCDQGNAIAHVPVLDLSVTCDDNNACTVQDACIGGNCKGAAISCDDSIGCTNDACDKTKGCTHTPVSSKCDDGDPCTKDGCDLAVGCTVTGFELGQSCDDGNACTVTDTCKNGVCSGTPSAEANCKCKTAADCGALAGTTSPCLGKVICATNGTCTVDKAAAVVCPSGEDSQCMKNQCDPNLGTCVMTAVTDGLDCNDGDACSSKAACKNGSCEGQSVIDCDDGNICTLDSCTPLAGCVHTASAATCDDGNQCTSGDQCASGVCIGTPKACDDGVPCTIDKCDSATGSCSHNGDSGQCDDANPCTTDACTGAAGCSHSPDATAICSDGVDCTVDKCDNGQCISINQCACTGNAECDDKNPCTDDVCSKGKCLNSAISNAPCDNGNACIVANTGTCQLGKCGGGQPVVCEGSGPCTSAVCSPTTGCQLLNKADGTPCDADGNGCTNPDVCLGGSCAAGPGVTCPGGGPCLAVDCASTGAASHSCTNTPIAAKTQCDDGLFCTVGDYCNGTGSCIGGGPSACDGSAVKNGCAQSVCDETAKACVSKFSDKATACDDGLFCTINDACDGQGNCVSGGANTCGGAMKTCKQNFCDEATKQCIITDLAGCCYSASDCDDGAPCTVEVCNMNGTTGTCAWKAAGTSSCCQPTPTGGFSRWFNAFDYNSLHQMTVQNSTGSPLQGWQLWSGSPIVHTPIGVLYYGNKTANNFDFGKSSGTASLPVQTLPTMPGAHLDFWLYFDTEFGGPYDMLSVQAVNSKGDAIKLWDRNMPSATGPMPQPKQWQQISINLDTVQGQTVTLQLAFDTVDAVGNNGQGVFIDELALVVPQCP